MKVQENLRRFRKVQESSGKFKKLKKDPGRFKKVKNGSKTSKKVPQGFKNFQWCSRCFKVQENSRRGRNSRRSMKVQNNSGRF